MADKKRTRRATRRVAAPAQPAAAQATNGRTEEDILLQRPIEVTLAGKQYEIALLPMRAQAAWRRKIVPLYTSFLGVAGVSSDQPEAFQSGIEQVLIGAPEQLAELFFEYAVELDKDEIETTATEWEVAAALKKIVEIVLPAPLLQALEGTLGRALQ